MHLSEASQKAAAGGRVATEEQQASRGAQHSSVQPYLLPQGSFHPLPRSPQHEVAPSGGEGFLEETDSDTGFAKRRRQGETWVPLCYLPFPLTPSTSQVLLSPLPGPNPAPHLGVELALEAAVLGELAEGLEPWRLREVRANWPWRGVRERGVVGAGCRFRHLPPWPGCNKSWGPLGWLFSEQLVVEGKVKAVCPQVEITALCCCSSRSQVLHVLSLQTTQGFSLSFCPFSETQTSCFQDLIRTLLLVLEEFKKIKKEQLVM